MFPYVYLLHSTNYTQLSHLYFRLYVRVRQTEKKFRYYFKKHLLLSQGSRFVTIKIRFEGHNHLQFWKEVFRLPTTLPQGHLAEVPL